MSSEPVYTENSPEGLGWVRREDLDREIDGELASAYQKPDGSIQMFYARSPHVIWSLTHPEQPEKDASGMLGSISAQIRTA